MAIGFNNPICSNKKEFLRVLNVHSVLFEPWMVSRGLREKGSSFLHSQSRQQWASHRNQALRAPASRAAADR
ncbi:MAG: hypothetical protein FD147_753 [Chloroflexi bacterium]|nr:MAG: hypothetical protein FD147_753 [Chloroflexota bacterium]